MPFKEQTCSFPGCEKVTKNLGVHMRVHAPKTVSKDPPVPEQEDLVPALLAKIVERLDALEKKVSPTATDMIGDAMNAINQLEPVPQSSVDEAGPVEIKCHPRYRELANQIIGEQFIVWEDYSGVPATHFRINVKIPDKISPNKGLTPDIRSKAVMNAEGESGVRDWFVLIRKNLNKYYSENALQSPFSNVM